MKFLVVGGRSGGAPILLLVGARLAAGGHGARWGRGRVRHGKNEKKRERQGSVDFLEFQILAAYFIFADGSAPRSGSKQLQERSAREPNTP
jgi:hypothetical protein